MPTDAPNPDAIEAELRQRQLPALAGRLPPGEFVVPDYDGLCLANIPATVAALLGGELPGACPPLRPELWRGWADGVRRVIFLLVDAMGYLQLREAMARGDVPAWNRLAERGALFPITTVFPSTTNAVLTTLWTGYSPAAHGLLAFELYLREFGVAASALFFWPIACHQHDLLVEWGLKPEEFVPVPALGETLSKQGIAVRTFIRKTYAESALSQMHRRGLEKIDGFVDASDLWVGLRRALGESQSERLFISAYWDVVDGISHKYGPNDDSWATELRNIGYMLEEEFLRRLTPAEREGTLLIITADHGEFLGEHFTRGHPDILFNPVLRIPLTFRYPQRIPSSVLEGYTSNVDVFPTALNLMGYSALIPEDVQGIDILDDHQTMSDRKLLCERIKGETGCYSLLADSYKLIINTDKDFLEKFPYDTLLLNLESDPAELQDLHVVQPELCDQMAADLSEWISRIRVETKTKIELSEDAVANLKALGYVQ